MITAQQALELSKNSGRAHALADQACQAVERAASRGETRCVFQAADVPTLVVPRVKLLLQAMGFEVQTVHVTPQQTLDVALSWGHAAALESDEPEPEPEPEPDAGKWTHRKFA